METINVIHMLYLLCHLHSAFGIISRDHVSLHRNAEQTHGGLNFLSSVAVAAGLSQYA